MLVLKAELPPTWSIFAQVIFNIGDLWSTSPIAYFLSIIMD